MNAYEIPNLRFSIPSGEKVTRRRFVGVNANGEGVLATVSKGTIGVSMNEAELGEVLEVSDGIVVVEASAEIIAGVSISVAADGKATTTAETAVVVGIALTGAAAAGQLVTVKIV